MKPVLSISIDHPALPGHFPGQPIVPGVVILDQIRQQLRREHPTLTVTGLKKIKFLRQLNPAETFIVAFTAIQADSVRFQCRLATSQTLLAEGRLAVQE